MNPALFAFHKQASIEVLTGRMGCGKTTTARKIKGQYDLVVATDFSRPKQPDGTYKTLERAEKESIRDDKREQIFKADSAGKKVLVEGHPPGVVKLFRDRLKDADVVREIPISLAESFKRVLQRAQEDPAERDVMQEMDSAVSNNGKYDDYLERIKKSGVKVEQYRGAVEKTAAAKLAPSTAVQTRLDEHLTPTNPHRWEGFGKSLRSRSFIEAFKNDERATPGQKRSAELRHLHLNAGKGESVKGTKLYRIKYHPDIDRFTCSCPDFVYKKSTLVKGDCKHIVQIKARNATDQTKARIDGYQNLSKEAGLPSRGLQLGVLYHGARNAERQGQVARAAADAYEQAFPDQRHPFTQPIRPITHGLREIAHEALLPNRGIYLS